MNHVVLYSLVSYLLQNKIGCYEVLADLLCGIAHICERILKGAVIRTNVGITCGNLSEEKANVCSSLSQVRITVAYRSFVSVYVTLNLVIFETGKVNSHIGVPVTQSRILDKYDITDRDHEKGLVEFSCLITETTRTTCRCISWRDSAFQPV